MKKISKTFVLYYNRWSSYTRIIFAVPVNKTFLYEHLLLKICFFVIGIFCGHQTIVHLLHWLRLLKNASHRRYQTTSKSQSWWKTSKIIIEIFKLSKGTKKTHLKLNSIHRPEIGRQVSNQIFIMKIHSTVLLEKSLKLHSHTLPLKFNAKFQSTESVLVYWLDIWCQDILIL